MKIVIDVPDLDDVEIAFRHAKSALQSAGEDNCTNSYCKGFYAAVQNTLDNLLGEIRKRQPAGEAT